MSSAPRALAVTVLTAGLLAAPLTIGAAGAASAASGDCTTWVSNSGQTGNVKCTSPGTAMRQHQAIVTCVNGAGHTFTVTGQWAYAGHTSSATCSAGGTAGVLSISYDRRTKG
ncbi:hypothetical protein ACFY71_23465 [Streptomyces cinerochromogenes]|uniref:Uncharacterized protein n=1 Tax=Streptomyces cinerochromogenes TaxID=66422 RepID=A0ABW7B216_9ACTN